ncbi:hypothetical protein B7463_g3713, partial [Scytalidium lignicola]
MARRPSNWRMYGKMLAVGIVVCVGGPAFTYWVTPTEEELFLKYNPDLQKRSLANRQGTQQDFDDFVNRLKEYSKSDKPSEFFYGVPWMVLLSPNDSPVWEAAADAEKKRREEQIAEQGKIMEEVNARKEAIKKQLN